MLAEGLDQMTALDRCHSAGVVPVAAGKDQLAVREVGELLS
jgi:hypothetical protein